MSGPNGTGAEGLGWCYADLGEDEDGNQINKDQGKWGLCSRSCKFFSDYSSEIFFSQQETKQFLEFLIDFSFYMEDLFCVKCTFRK